MSPVHVIAVEPASAFEFTEGAEFVTKDTDGTEYGHGCANSNDYGKMIHAFCSKCGVQVYQQPDGKDFHSIFPTNFHIEDEGNCRLPEKYLPKAHINYENRQYDWCDNLPKFKGFPPEPMVDNQGNEILSTKTTNEKSVKNLIGKVNSTPSIEILLF
jgi:hypothetical protein